MNHGSIPAALEKLESLQILLSQNNPSRLVPIPFRYLTLPKLQTLTLTDSLFKISWRHRDFLQFIARSQCSIKEI